MTPFFINSNICVSKADVTDLSTFMNCVCWNTGNSYITYSLIKTFFGKMVKINHIPNIYLYDFSKQDKDIDFINTCCSHVFLILQDQIRIEEESYGYQLPYKLLENFIRKIQKPILVAGLGINCFQEIPSDFHQRLHPDLVSLLHTISDKCKIIGVRGVTTQEILEKLGIKNTQAIGCPSFYEKGANRIVSKKEYSHELNVILSNPQRYELASRYPIILQAERHLIEAAAFEKRQYNDLTDDEFYLIQRKKYYVFSSIEDWKNFVSSFDFLIGHRLHGCILGINSGVPSLCMNSDARAKEMTSLLKIPYYPEYTNCLNIEEIYARCDYSEMNKIYPKLYNDFIGFLKTNSFEPYLSSLEYTEQPSLPLYTCLEENNQANLLYHLKKIENLALVGKKKGCAFVKIYLKYCFYRLLSHLFFGARKEQYRKVKTSLKQILERK